MTNFKNLSLALALVAMLSISLAVPMTTQKAHAEDIRTLTIADTTHQATGQALYSGSISFYGERFTNPSNIILIEVDCAYVELRKVGSPTGNLEVGFYDTSRNLIKSFGTKDVSTLTGSYTLYSFCLPDTDSGHLIQKDTILAVTYSGGDSSNKVDVRRSNIADGTDPDYDGIDSYLSYYDGSWHNYNSPTNSRDLLFKLTNTFDYSIYGYDGIASACDQIADQQSKPILTDDFQLGTVVRDVGRCVDRDTEYDSYDFIWAQEVVTDTQFKVRSYVQYPQASQEQRGYITGAAYCAAQFDENNGWLCSGSWTSVGTDQFSDVDGYAEWTLNLTEDSGKYLLKADGAGDNKCMSTSPISCGNGFPIQSKYILLDTN